MGIDTFIKMPTLPYDGIHHIDMHMKLLDEQTLLVAQYPDGVADGPQINENLDYVLQNYTSTFGTPYRVFRIDSPPSASGLYPDNGGAYRTYTNAVFVNKSVIVPTYRPEVDGPALQLYQQLLPGYNIVGIDVDNSGQNLISQSGAIHCITHTIGVSDPLLIVHQPVYEAPALSTQTLTALIKHNSGIASATLVFRTAGSTTWEEMAMIPGANDLWTAAITMPETAVQYFIRATANSGKTLTRPLPAPQSYWTIATQVLSSEEWAANHITGPYPNPATEVAHFNFDRIAGPVQITITDMLGRTLYEGDLPAANGNLTLDLNPSWQGTLLVHFSGNFGKITRKLIKQ